MNIVRRVVPTLLLVAIAGCAAKVDIEAARESLLHTDKQWARVSSEGIDVDQIVSFWSDDATIFPPEVPAIRGKEAIRQFVAGSMEIPGFSVSWEPSEVVIAPGGDFGYTTGANAFTVPDTDGNLITTHGRYVTVWKKETDGSWKCVMDIWNAEPPGQVSN